jgi:hypothetical protein
MPNSKEVVLSVFPGAIVGSYVQGANEPVKFSIKHEGKWLPSSQSISISYSPNQAWDNLVKSQHFREQVITGMATSLNKFLRGLDLVTMMDPPKAVEVSDPEATIPTELKHKIPESETLSRDW